MFISGRLLDDPAKPPQMGWMRLEGGRIIDMGHGACPTAPDAGDDRSVICPGFIDAHTHLPQIESIGCDGLTLLDWLKHEIYPAESAWADDAIMHRRIDQAHRRMLQSRARWATRGISPVIRKGSTPCGAVMRRCRFGRSWVNA